MRTALLATAIRTQRAETVAILERVAAAGDAAPDAARQLAAHLLAGDAALVRGRVGALLRIPPEPGPLIGVNPVATARWQDEDLRRLPRLLERSGERLARRVRLAAPLGRVPLRGAAGRWSLRGLVAWRVLDEWVRAGDLVRGVGAGDADDAPPVDAVRGRVLADVVLGTFPRRVLPRLPRAAGAVRLVVELATPVAEEVGLALGPRRTWGIDYARRQYGPRVTAAPDAVVRVTAPALVLVAAGRVAWRRLPEEALRIDGDAAAAADVLDAVAPVSTEHPG